MFIDNARVQTPETQNLMTAQIALQLLKEGNERFFNDERLSRNLKEQVAQTASGQYPFAVVLSCIDSRVPVETIFDQGIGDVFSARVAGNIVDEDILGSMEFACKFAGSKLILVLGHTACGAVKGACDGVEAGNLTLLLDKIKPAVEATPSGEGEERSSRNEAFVNRVAAKNVEQTIQNILSQSSILKELFDQGEIDIVGAMYDVQTGRVDFDILQA